MLAISIATMMGSAANRAVLQSCSCEYVAASRIGGPHAHTRSRTPTGGRCSPHGLLDFDLVLSTEALIEP
jgi:hypothetical protein